jgi:putative transcriptional regulator
MAIKILLSKKLGELRWTQADLARKTGIRPTTINEMYHEICERVNLDHLDRICEALDCDICDIIVRVPGGSAVEVSQRTRAGRERW